MCSFNCAWEVILSVPIHLLECAAATDITQHRCAPALNYVIKDRCGVCDVPVVPNNHNNSNNITIIVIISPAILEYSITCSSRTTLSNFNLCQQTKFWWMYHFIRILFPPKFRLCRFATLNVPDNLLSNRNNRKNHYS